MSIKYDLSNVDEKVIAKATKYIDIYSELGLRELKSMSLKRIADKEIEIVETELEYTWTEVQKRCRIKSIRKEIELEKIDTKIYDVALKLFMNRLEVYN